ncbi:PKD domain-containing protein [Hyalangium rubrum]|uniref:PKD domain-containing protein n=1 Tax=Hyalangium rubrum TaxID=3103134 RepID=A0ABU5H8F3_9BACT|nr:PKD domain-containing protein [Hyalangium sp. s54d21]MDY7229590.1 PKD domain-containing protein [Hyalangium sp. s54d21]
MSLRILLMLALVALAACGGDKSQPPPPPPPENAAPSASILSPTDGATLLGAGPHELTGSATDPEDGPLSGTALRWSSSLDGPLGTGSPLSVRLSGGEHRLSLDVTDSGGKQARAQLSVTVIVEDQPPVATIESPTAGATFEEGTPIPLKGKAVDPETGALSGAALTWSSDSGGIIGTGTQLSFTGAARGVHRLLLSAVDPGGQAGYASVTVTVVPPGTNQKPVVTLTQPTEGSRFFTTQAITLEGSATDAEDGTLADSALAWTSSKDGTLGTGRQVTGVVLSAGVHALTLTATDSLGATASASVLVTVTVQGQTAPSVTITRPVNGFTLFAGTPLTLEGTATDAEDGTLSGAALRWSSSLAGALGTGSPLTVPGLSAGSHEIFFTARDSSGTEGAARIRVEVLPTNDPPTVQITSPANGSHFTVGAVVALRGTGQDPEDGVLTGNSLTWQSSLGGQLGHGPSLDVSSLEAGTHQLTLTAADSGGRMASASIQLIIDPAQVKLPPVARLTGPAQAEARRVATFDGATSSDPDGTVNRYRFDFGDATTPMDGTAPQASHTYAAPGTYTVTLEVTDNDGLTATATRTVTVTPYVRVPEVVAEGPEFFGSACQLEMRGAVAHLAFRGVTHPSLWYGTRTGTTWAMEQVDGMGFNTGGMVLESLAMTVAADGTPHLVYLMSGKGLWYATRSGNTWIRERVDSAATPVEPSTWVSIALDPSNGNRPTVVYGWYGSVTDVGTVWRTAVAYRTGAAAWSSARVSFPTTATSHQQPLGDAVFSPSGTLYIPYGGNFLGAWKSTGSAEALTLPEFLGSARVSTAWTSTGPMLLFASGLHRVTLRTPFSASTVSTSLVEAFSLSELAVAADAGGNPRLAFTHGGELEVVRRGTNDYWSRTDDLSQVDSAEIDATVDAQDETRVCFFRAGKLLLY